MNDNPTLRPFESYLDEVAIEQGYEDYADAETESVMNLDHTSASILREAANRMLEDAFKAQKEICAEHAEAEIEEIYIGDTGSIGSLYKEVAIVDKSSIINAPTPTIDNQNTN